MPSLPDGGLHVCRLDLGAPDADRLLSYAFEALTSDERIRAEKMRPGTAPKEFIAGRGYLRRLLGRELHCDPRNVGLTAGPHRKPEVQSHVTTRAPWFNVSHSHGMVLIALSRAGSVGIDVEYVQATVLALALARDAFDPVDLAEIEGAASKDAQVEAFYRCWTRREAVAKADGRGLTLPASKFAAGTDCSQQHLVHLRGGSNGQEEWEQDGSSYFVSSLKVGVHHEAAVAVAGVGAVAQLFDLSRLCCPAVAKPLLIAREGERRQAVLDRRVG